MNKANYLKRNVKFVDFLNKVIKGEVPINHSYLDEAFCFESLESAFDSYVFPFSSNSKNTYKRDPVKWRAKYDTKLFPSNKKKLDIIKECLNDEFVKSEANDSLFFEAIKKGLYWGATGEVNVPENANRQGTYLANVQWIENNYVLHDGLTDNFKCAVREIESDDFDETLFGKEKSYRMNAGFTKIYALLAKNSIIYDGRVGAALGYIVTLFCEQTGEEFTEDLNFYWGASESKGRFRNPSIPEKGFDFKKLSNSNESGWALCNVKANWLLSSAIEKLENSFKFGGYGKKDILHAVEAALFMLGYDFPQYAVSQSIKPKAVNKKNDKTKRNSEQNRKITNHVMLFRDLQNSTCSLPNIFTYTDIMELVASLDTNPSTSGVTYASLKFIQKYCSIIKGDVYTFDHFKELSDPRKFSSLVELKNDWQFKLGKL